MITDDQIMSAFFVVYAAIVIVFMSAVYVSEKRRKDKDNGI